MAASAGPPPGTPDVFAPPDRESDLAALFSRSANAEFAVLKTGVAVRSREVRQTRKRQFELFRQYLAAQARANRWGFLGKVFGGAMAALGAMAIFFPPAAPLAGPLSLGAAAASGAGRIAKGIENLRGADHLSRSLLSRRAQQEAMEARAETLRQLESAARIEQAMGRRLRELGEIASDCRRLAALGRES
jgi:hypothetical protein